MFIEQNGPVSWNWISLTSRGVALIASTQRCFIWTLYISIQCRQAVFWNLILIYWKYELHRSPFISFLMQIYFLKSGIYHRGMWEMVPVVVIYLQLSVSNLLRPRWDKLPRRCCSIKEHILQSCKPSNSIWYIPSQYKLSVRIRVRFTYLQKSCISVIREQRPTTQVNYSTAVQRSHAKLFMKFWGVTLTLNIATWIGFAR